MTEKVINLQEFRNTVTKKKEDEKSKILKNLLPLEYSIDIAILEWSEEIHNVVYEISNPALDDLPEGRVILLQNLMMIIEYLCTTDPSLAQYIYLWLAEREDNDAEPIEIDLEADDEDI
jgi:hypothetical protein